MRPRRINSLAASRSAKSEKECLPGEVRARVKTRPRRLVPEVLKPDCTRKPPEEHSGCPSTALRPIETERGVGTSICVRQIAPGDSIVKPGAEKVDVYGNVSMVLIHNWSSINGSLK